MIRSYIAYPGLTDDERIHLGETISRESGDYQVNCMKMKNPPKSIPHEVMVITGNATRPLAKVADLGEHQTRVFLDTKQGRKFAKLIDDYVPPFVSSEQLRIERTSS